MIRNKYVFVSRYLTINLNMSLINHIIIGFIALLFFGNVFAAEPSTDPMNFDKWRERLKSQAFSKGISVKTLQAAYSQVRLLDLRSMGASQRASLAPWSLQNSLATSKRLLQQYGDALFEISHLFGVDAAVLAALAGMENQTNNNLHSAVNVLVNLSFTNPRDIHWQNELLQALKIIDDGQITSEELTSDLDGNLGITRFKPTVFRDYAIDFDSDGRFDLWQNYPDIFASTANYLSNIGWKTGQSWGIEVSLPKGLNADLMNINQQKSLKIWRKLGLIQADGNELPASETLGSLIKIEHDKFFIVLDNYFTLLRWRRSASYAYTVGQLIELLRLKPTITP